MNDKNESPEQTCPEDFLIALQISYCTASCGYPL